MFICVETEWRVYCLYGHSLNYKDRSIYWSEINLGPCGLCGIVGNEFADNAAKNEESQLRIKIEKI